jgi:uncharacterized membrane protein YkgB
VFFAFLCVSPATGEDGLMPESEETKSDGILINEVQLVLAEKRTWLATLRTGIAVFALPLSVLSLLIATSKYYDVMDVLDWLIPLLATCGALVVLGSYLIVRSIAHLHRQDQLILKLKREHSRMAKLMD